MATYTVRAGDTLAAIGTRFTIPWQAIWNYNTKVVKPPRLRSGNPNVINPGETIIIPRTVLQYDQVLRQLEELRQQVGSDFDGFDADLNSAKADADHVGENVDLAADLALIGRSAVKASLKYGGIVLETKLKKEALRAVEKIAMHLAEPGSGTEGLVVSNTGSAACDQGAMLTARGQLDGTKFVHKFGKDMAKDLGKKSAKLVAKSAAPVEMANGVADAVGMLLDFVVSGLDSMKPSSVARAWVWATDGEHPDDTHKRYKDMIARTKEQTLRRLQESIGRLRQEKLVVYGR